MGLELVTAYWGKDHVTPEQEADKNAGDFGTGCYVLPLGEKCRAEAVTSNQVRIFDGTGFVYGRQFHIEEGAYENVTIENGTAGLLRNDLIVLKYKKDEETGVEGISFEVLKGTSAETAKDPTPNNVDIRTGVFESEIPLYRIRLNGLAIEAVEEMFTVLYTKEEMQQKLDELNSKLIDSHGNTYIKIGKLVVATFGFISPGLSQNDVIPDFTLPQPDINVDSYGNTPLFGYATQTGKTYPIVVQSNGACVCKGVDDIPSGIAVSVSGAYVAT